MIILTACKHSIRGFDPSEFLNRTDRFEKNTQISGRVNVLPSGKEAFVVKCSEKMRPVPNIPDTRSLAKYWMDMYGYDIGEKLLNDDETYVQISFSSRPNYHTRPLTYPASCLFSGDLQCRIPLRVDEKFELVESLIKILNEKYSSIFEKSECEAYDIAESQVLPALGNVSSEECNEFLRPKIQKLSKGHEGSIDSSQKSPIPMFCVKSLPEKLKSTFSYSNATNSSPMIERNLKVNERLKNMLSKREE